jgi:ribosomal protein S18 acetylase RimI-like enzyme
MNWYKLSQITDLAFENNHIDSHHQQHDYNLLAKQNNKSVGMMEYTIFDNTLYINNIVVSPNLRRQKIATQMIHKMKELNPNMTIHWGIMSDEGYALRQSI